jgi:hypothetical protein
MQNFSPIIEPKCSLPFPTDPTTDRYPKSHESSFEPSIQRF